jgi:hypothetical protein
MDQPTRKTTVKKVTDLRIIHTFLRPSKKIPLTAPSQQLSHHSVHPIQLILSGAKSSF